MLPKQKYRLQTVLDVREKAKKDAAQFVALRRQQLAEAEAELERRQKAVQSNQQLQRQAQNKMMIEIGNGAEAQRALAYRTHLTDLREQEVTLRENVQKQEEVIQKAQQEVDRALDLLAEATKDVKVIETHKETWRTNQKREFERREQKLNDEIGAILYSPKRNR